MTVSTDQTRRRAAAVVLALLALPGCSGGSAPPFSLTDATIESVHAALAAGELSCEELVRGYLDRIEAFDDQGPELKAILAVHPAALETAREMDELRAAGGGRGPLHCIPVIVKDNFDTSDMPTTGGSVTLAASVPPDDAFFVRRLRDAGALVLAKSNLTELAQGGTTVSSLGGQTLNPYDLGRTPGGSSGGTGAAIAAGFGVLGTGSDTGQSIRSPASANGLVGVRPTHGLVSRDGVIPLSGTQDAVGPITRTVNDAARMLGVVAGYDPNDRVTEASRGRVPDSYVDALDPNALQGARIGLLVDVMGTEPVHAEVNAIVADAVSTMERLGAEVLEVSTPGVIELGASVNVMDFEFRATFDDYLASLGQGAPVGSLEEFVARGEFDPAIRRGLEAGLASEGLGTVEYGVCIRRRDELRDVLMTAITENELDALFYPHQRRLVAEIGEAQLERNGMLSHGTGLPAVTFPGGFSPPTESAPIGVPVGIELLGPEWSEARLLALAYAFEQGTAARQPPTATPTLR